MMAFAASFTATTPWKRLYCESNAKPVIVFLTSKTTPQFGKSILETNQNAIPRERNTQMKTHRFYHVLASKRGNFLSSSSFSPSEMIKDFYACINDGKLKHLAKYISTDCHIEECSFPTPFEGREEVLYFFDQLIASMGENVKFRVKQVCEGDELIAAANWHIEWKNIEIPFTRGCSFFECSKEGEKLVIKKAQIVIESPVKPGHLVLVLLKIVTTAFDNFPKTAECMLKYLNPPIRGSYRVLTLYYNGY